MSSDLTRIVTTVFAASILGTACADFARGSAAPDGAGGDMSGDSGADTGASSFAADVHALLLDGCQGCHAAGEQAGDTQLLLTGDAAADLATVSAFVNPAAPAGSRLLTKMSGQGHGGGSVYAPDSAPYRAVLRWIQEGARP